ncbi:MAG: hypothetical protein H0U76_29865 [Ktedonobacteraceae bacterium]|nr:hypothetical protein [Ktedonobacteraceae bacterium]
MHKYCKAYTLGQLRQWSAWSEQSEGSEPELTDESIVYLWDDFIVVRSPVQEQGIIFDAVTPEWRDFCTNTLHFEIPEDLRYAYQQAEEPA